jgi:hypothetical protein
MVKKQNKESVETLRHENATRENIPTAEYRKPSGPACSSDLEKIMEFEVLWLSTDRSVVFQDGYELTSSRHAR